MALNDKYPRNGLRLCIDEVGDMLSGRFYSPMEADPQYFQGVGDFLLKADTLFEEHRFPQSFVQKRSFRGEQQLVGYRGVPAVTCTTDILQEKGAVSTFNVIVTSRRNATWQGILQDETGTSLGAFQGEMGLLELLRNAHKDN